MNRTPKQQKRRAEPDRWAIVTGSEHVGGGSLLGACLCLNFHDRNPRTRNLEKAK